MSLLRSCVVSFLSCDFLLRVFHAVTADSLLGRGQCLGSLQAFWNRMTFQEFQGLRSGLGGIGAIVFRGNGRRFPRVVQEIKKLAGPIVGLASPGNTVIV